MICFELMKDLFLNDIMVLKFLYYNSSLSICNITNIWNICWNLKKGLDIYSRVGK